MHFDSWQAFWDMGGYGFFVWLSFGVSLLSMIAIVIDNVWARKVLIQQVQAQQARKVRIQQSKEQQSGDTADEFKFKQGNEK